MFSSKHIKKPFQILLCFITTLTLISFINSTENKIEIEGVSFQFNNETSSFNLSISKQNKQNQTETKRISMKISDFREVFPNKLSSKNFTDFPLMRQTDNNTRFHEQLITCNKINLQADNFFSLNASSNSNSNLVNSVNLTALEIQYFLFQEPGWIDDQTNYVRPGNLMIEINLSNYSFCENLADDYNKILEVNKNASAIANFDINEFPNCKGIWVKDEKTGKINLRENKNFNINNVSDSSFKNMKNKSYFELAFELNTTDDTNLVYDDPNKVLELNTNNSYLRLYQSIKLDDKEAFMEEGFPSVNWNTESKRIVLQIPKFRSKATAWIFVDMNYLKPPANYKGFANIAFYIILVLFVLLGVYMLIKRKRMKKQLIMEEKLQNLSNV